MHIAPRAPLADDLPVEPDAVAIRAQIAVAQMGIAVNQAQGRRIGHFLLTQLQECGIDAIGIFHSPGRQQLEM